MGNESKRPNFWRIVPLLLLLVAVLVTGGIALAGVPTSSPIGKAAPPVQAKADTNNQGRPRVNTGTGTNTGNGNTAKPAPPAAPNVTLYDQYDNASSTSSSSQDFEAAQVAFSDQVADDFAVPSGQNWSVNEVDVQGVYYNCTTCGPAVSFNVYFYQNSGSLPATPVYTATGLAYTNTAGNFVIPLTTPANLAGGGGGATYWVSAQARLDFGAGGQFGWTDRTVQSTSAAAFRNPGGGFACSGGNDWVVKTTCVTSGGPDQVFRLVGTIGGGVTATPTCVPGGGGGLPGPWATATTGPAVRYRGGGVSDGTYVYVFGGSDGAADYLNDLWRWDPSTETWTALANMPTGKSNIQGAYWNGKIYVSGGYTGTHITENAIYDIATNTWSTGAPLPAPQSGQQAAYNNKIYDIGGNPGPQTTVSIYDIATDTWSTGASMPVATTYGRAITVGSYIYYVGGIQVATTNAVYRYDPVGNTWATMAPLQTARTSEELMSDAAGTEIFAVMGGDSTFFTGIPLAQSVEIYDIATDTWAYGNPVVTKAAAPSGGRAGDKLMVEGGVDNTNYYDTVQVSTLTSNSCATPTTAPTDTPTSTTPPDTNTPTDTPTNTPTTPPTQTPGGDTATPVPTDTATTEPTQTPGGPSATPVSPSATPGSATATPTACTLTFSDVPPSNAFYAFIRCLACKGIINGYPDGTFKPGNNVTRGQLSKIVANAAGFDDNQTTQMFEDVPVDATFFQFIGRLASRGFINGYTCGGPGEPCGSGNLPYFRPNANSTRGQISKIVSNAVGFTDTATGQQFEDVATNNAFYTFIYRLVHHNVMSGYPCGTPPAGQCGSGNLPYFLPNNNATRGQTSKIVANTFFPSCNPPEAVER